MTLKKDILDFLEKLSTEYDFDFSFDDDTDLVDILKAHNFKPNVDSDDLLTGLLDFIVLTNKYCSFEAYVKFLLLKVKTAFTHFRKKIFIFWIKICAKLLKKDDFWLII